MGRYILHVDMNAFYASVECQRRPELRQKPVAVCGDPEARHGIVLTANYVAKPRGVKTGMTIWQAKQLCPDLVVLSADMREYIRFSKMAREIYEKYTDQIEPFGLDESWLDVTGSVGLFGSAVSIAEEISKRIKFELGITASIGVSDNKITAKLGSDYKKPDAITRIERDNYKEIVYPLPASDLLYVGPATERKLRGVGIYTIGQVLHTFANGLDVSPVQRSDHIRAIKSVGNSATTPRDLVSDDDVRLMLYLLAESVACRMRELASKCTVVEVAVRDTKLHWYCRQKKLAVPTCSSAEIAEVAFDLFRRSYSWIAPIRSIGVRGTDLVDATIGIQTSLFDNDRRRSAWEQIDVTMDRLRQRYGYMSVRRAITMSDPALGCINPKDDHTVHPIGYFAG